MHKIHARQYIGSALKPIALSAIPDDHPVARFYHHWASFPPDRPCSWQQCARPVDVPDILPLIVVLDRLNKDEERFTYRHAGTLITEMIGKDPTGEDFGYDLDHSTRITQIALMIAALNRREGTLLRGVIAAEGKPEKPIILGAFPTSSNQADWNQLILVMDLG